MNRRWARRLWLMSPFLCTISVYVLHLRRQDDPVRTIEHPEEVNLPESLFINTTQADENARIQRITRLHESCDKLPRQTTGETFGYKKRVPNFLFDTKHYVWVQCIPKTGSSTWKLALCNSSGNIELQSPQAVQMGQSLHEIHAASRSCNNNTVVKKSFNGDKRGSVILTVRNPLDRLESAYVDKIWRFAGNILEARGNLTSREIAEMPKNQTSVKFDEFLNYALSRPNPHWTSIYAQAHPCALPYNFISKTETLTRDLSYIVQNKLKSPVPYVDQLNVMRPKQPGKDTSQPGRFLPLWSTIANQTYWIDRVAEVYKYDFLLFGYTYSIVNGDVYALCKEYDGFGRCV